MKITKSIIATFVALTGFAAAANVTYSGSALSNLQGSTAVDLTAGKLVLVIADTTGNGFGAVSGDLALLAAGTTVGGTFGGDLIVARLGSSVLGDSFGPGGFTWNTTVFPASTQWAVVWFETVTLADPTITANAKYGIARGSNWTTPALEPAAGQTLTYATSPAVGAPFRIVLNNGGSATALPANAAFATNGTTLSIVPEPSAALLGMLGALGLLRRRR